MLIYYFQEPVCQAPLYEGALASLFNLELNENAQ